MCVSVYPFFFSGSRQILSPTPATHRTGRRIANFSSYSHRYARKDTAREALSCPCVYTYIHKHTRRTTWSRDPKCVFFHIVIIIIVVIIIFRKRLYRFCARRMHVRSFGATCGATGFVLKGEKKIEFLFYIRAFLSTVCAFSWPVYYGLLSSDSRLFSYSSKIVLYFVRTCTQFFLPFPLKSKCSPNTYLLYVHIETRLCVIRT